jgi:hypothetical protein
MPDYWTNASVLAFAGDVDPVQAIEAAAKRVVYEAVEKGWNGPPFDPFDLARILDIEILARAELADARTVPVGGGEVAIEYNPDRPRHRLLFSVAHEIVHTLFADVSDFARYRANRAAGPPDEWQLELLCNIGAGEILMPTETLPMLRDSPLEIEVLMQLRAEFGVSTEALLRRATKLANYPIAMFAASRTDASTADSPFKIDYTVPSRAWAPPIRPGWRRPGDSVLSECTAVGFTAKRREDWSDHLRAVAVQAVATPPFPGQRFPRVLGLLSPRGVRAVDDVAPVEVHGDALSPRGTGERIIVHLVNDKTPNWGGAFARALRDRYPEAQRDFRLWINEDRRRLKLGEALVTEVEPGLHVATIIGQHGYGSSTAPRIRYAAVEQALISVADVAHELSATVHMPRIGAGQARGRWPVIREIIESTLTRKGIRVTIYIPPGQPVSGEHESRRELTLGF